MLFFHQICKHRFTIIIYMHLSPLISPKKQTCEQIWILLFFIYLHTFLLHYENPSKPHIYICKTMFFHSWKRQQRQRKCVLIKILEIYVFSSSDMQTSIYYHYLHACRTSDFYAKTTNNNIFVFLEYARLVLLQYSAHLDFPTQHFLEALDAPGRSWTLLAAPVGSSRLLDAPGGGNRETQEWRDCGISETSTVTIT